MGPKVLTNLPGTLAAHGTPIGKPSCNVTDRNSLARGHVQALFFTRFLLRRVAFKEVTQAYTDWILGRGTFAGKRDARRRGGILPQWTAADFHDATTLHGDLDCELAVRNTSGALLCRWRHRDAQDGGVLWHNVIRVQAVGNDTQVEHAVMRSWPRDAEVPDQPSCPGVVVHLVSQYAGKTSPQELALKARVSLASSEVEGFIRYQLLDRSRELPVVVVSPRDDAEPLVSAEKLGMALRGMATVVELADPVATFVWKNELEKRGLPQMGCFRGAVRTYGPRLTPGPEAYAHVLLPHVIEAYPPTEATGRVAAEVARRVARSRMPSDFYGVIERYDRARHQATVQSLLASVDAVRTVEQGKYSEAVAERDLLIEKLHRELSDSTRISDMAVDETGRLQAENEALGEQLDRARDRLRESESFTEELRVALRNIKAKRGPALTDDELGALGRIITGQATVSDYLRATIAAHPEQVVALPSALKSAEQIAEFDSPEKVGELLWLLATEYRAALVSGKGDTEARRVFGSAYAARESEMTRQNGAARAMRTFDYEGVPITMEKHLKVGVKESDFETARVYFHWDAEHGRIVIGHCGRHLPLA